MSRRYNWHVEFLPTARRELLALRTPVQSHLRSAITMLANDPTPADSIAMRGKGTGLHRLRVGVYPTFTDGPAITTVDAPMA